METIYVRRVVERQKSPFYIIHGDNGVKYATDNPLKASLCQRACVKGLPLKVLGLGGWYYKHLDTVELGDERIAS